MKTKYLLLLFLNLTGFISSYSQVHVSVSLDYEIILGPENVIGNKGIAAPFYVTRLNDIKSELFNTITEELGSITELENKEKLNRKEKTKLKEAQEAKAIVDYEIEKIDSLINLWNAEKLFQESLIEAAALIDQGKCIEFTTKNGKFYSDELKMEKKDIQEEINCKEWFAVEYMEPTTTWVRKKADPNCISSDPNDCIVWCLVEEKGGIILIDLSGNEITYDHCPSDFEYDGSGSQCYRTVSFKEAAEKLGVISLVRNRSNEILLAIDWRVIDCNN